MHNADDMWPLMARGTREDTVTEELKEARGARNDGAPLRLQTLSLSLSDDALAELAEIVALPPGPLNYDVASTTLMERMTKASDQVDASYTVWLWLWRDQEFDVTLCLGLPGISGRVLYTTRLTQAGPPWVTESVVQCFWGDARSAGRGEPSLRLNVDQVRLRRGTAIGGVNPEETATLGRLLGRLIADLGAVPPGVRPAPPEGERQQTTTTPSRRQDVASPDWRRSRGTATPPRSANGRTRDDSTSDDKSAQHDVTVAPTVDVVVEEDELELAVSPESTQSSTLFDWVETQQAPTIVIPPDLSAAAETVLEGMPVTPLAFHLYWLRRAVDAQYEREASLASAQSWRYEIVPVDGAPATDEVTVRVTRIRGSSAAPDVGESVEATGSNAATGWRVVRVDSHNVTLRPASSETPALPDHGILAPRANRRVAEVKRETIDMIAGGRNGAATLRALMANPSDAHCSQALADPGSALQKAIDHGTDPGLVGNLYPAQRQAVLQALGMTHGDVLLIQGPPGTGKTTTIVAIVRALVAKGSRILLCSQSNLGVDNALERLHAADPKLGLVRVGNPELVLPSVRPLLIEENGGGEAKADRVPVVGGTCAGVALSRAGNGRTYDYVIVDEANKARMDEMMLACARGERLILVGDHNQLPPYP